MHILKLRCFIHPIRTGVILVTLCLTGITISFGEPDPGEDFPPDPGKDLPHAGIPLPEFPPEEVTLLTAHQRFGLPEWSLDEWPVPVDEEFRIFFAPTSGGAVKMFRVAIGKEAVWVETRQLTEARLPHWGKLLHREAKLIPDRAVIDTIRNLFKDKALYLPLTGVEHALLMSIGAESVWIVDYATQTRRQSLIVRNADLVDDTHLHKDLRDFSNYPTIWKAFEKLFASVREGAER